MQLNQVRYFIEAARLLNFTRAAAVCNVSQPALTKGVKTLEDELGGALFHRAPKLCLTDLGKRVLPYLEQTFEAANAVQQQARCHRSGELAPISIGFDPSVQSTVVLPILAELNRAIPGFSMQLCSVDQEAMVQGLLGGDLDLAVRAHDSTPDRHPFHHLPLTTEKLIVVCAPTHALAKSNGVDLKSLLADSDRISFCMTAEKQLTSLGLAQPPRHRADSRDQISQLIQMGAGWALLPEDSTVARENASLDVVGADVSRVIELIYPAGRPHGAAVSAFLRLARIGRRPTLLTAA